MIVSKEGRTCRRRSSCAAGGVERCQLTSSACRAATSGKGTHLGVVELFADAVEAVVDLLVVLLGAVGPVLALPRRLLRSPRPCQTSRVLVLLRVRVVGVGGEGGATRRAVRLEGGRKTRARVRGVEARVDVGGGRHGRGGRLSRRVREGAEARAVVEKLVREARRAGRGCGRGDSRREVEGTRPRLGRRRLGPGLWRS